MSKNAPSVVIDGNTKIPMYAVYAIVGLVAFLVAFFVRLEIVQSHQDAKVDLLKDFVGQIQVDQKEQAKIQLETVSKLGELTGELKAIKEMQIKK